jgi:predicted glycoside hydrolase/deacetylase ChbG (UPF0249 family)
LITRTLIITADDFGLHPSYDAGMIEAATAGAIDGVGVMVDRTPLRVAELANRSVAIGLHLDEGDGTLDARGVRIQVESFERLVGRPPGYIDGHHHCHASPAIARVVAAAAAELDAPVRSVSAAHRLMLRAAGVRTPDLLIGRYEESEPVLPAELLAPPPEASSMEWMVHPGRPDPASGSSYDRGRGEDLAALLALELPAGLVRAGHGALIRLPTGD